MHQIRQRLSYANVMATIAIFIALGGASYAAIKLPKNSVGAKQIKKNAVTSAKIKDGAVTGSKIDAKTLGTVPRATSAATAASATTAANAATAANASALGGQPASAFAASSQIASGGARLSGNPQTILSVPGLSLSSKASNLDEIRFKADVGSEWAITSDSTPASLLSGESVDLSIASGYIETFSAKRYNPTAYWAITCMFNFFGESIDCVAVGK